VQGRRRECNGGGVRAVVPVGDSGACPGFGAHAPALECCCLLEPLLNGSNLGLNVGSI
jgi:hypothetical protein